MSAAAACARLLLLLGVAFHVANAINTEGLMMPGHARHDARGPNQVCRSFRLCHSSKGLAWTSMDVFAALEPLLAQLQLTPATDYVELVPLQDRCLSIECCCSTPVELRLSLPTGGMAREAAAMQLQLAEDFILRRLPRDLKHTVCTSGKLVECPKPTLVAAEPARHTMREDDVAMPPLPAGLIPYDGRRQYELADEPKQPQRKQPQPRQPQPKQPQQPQPQPKKKHQRPKTDDVAMPPLPAGLIPYDGRRQYELADEPKQPQRKPPQPKQPQQPQPQPKKQHQRPKTDEVAMPPLPPGLVPYDGRRQYELADEPKQLKPRRLLQQEREAEAQPLVAPVPAMPAGASAFGGAAVLEAGHVGGYGGSVSRAPGSYDGARLPMASYAGEPSPPPASPVQPPPPEEGAEPGPTKFVVVKLPKLQVSVSTSGSGAGGHPAHPQGRHLLAEASRKQPAANSTGVSNSTSGRSAPPPRAEARAPGTCFCRYDPDAAGWALEQAACRSALFARCGPPGSLLECKQLEEHYAAIGMPGAESPHADAIAAYLYVECPPAPPCSCRALVDGPKERETPLARARCCQDLKAHCQAPFSGLDCEHVARFCRPGAHPPTDPVGVLFSYALVKTHGLDCSAPQYQQAYSSVVTAHTRAASASAEAAARVLSRAARAPGPVAGRLMDGDDDSTAALLVALAASLLLGVAVTATLLRAYDARQRRHAAPLLHG